MKKKTSHDHNAQAAVPLLSVVIPVFNEEAIVHRALSTFMDELRSLDRPFEVIVAANGCTDQTTAILEELLSHPPAFSPSGGLVGELVVMELPEANYGAALRRGIERARGRYVLCDEIDLCDVDFHRRALRRLEHDECDFVVGSKAMAGARDRRPLSRRLATRVMNGLLWATLDFHGSDTHGLKAFVRQTLQPVVAACVVDKDLFASELVIRAGRAGLRIQEIPIELEEQRSPPIALVKRVPRVARDLGRLVVAIRLKR